MTHKITVKDSQQPDMAAADFDALADRLIQESWHLPPQGDQSWREKDARRIFSEDGKDEINDEKDDDKKDTGPCIEEEDDPVPGFKVPRAAGLLLPVSLATFLAFFAVAFSAPEILTASFWSAPGPKALPPAMRPVLAANAAAPVSAQPEPNAAPDRLRPSLAYARRTQPRPGADKVLASVRPDRSGQTVGHGRSPIVKAGPADVPADVKEASRTAPRERRVATRLPPIGEAYFAHRRAQVASSDWKAEAARWDAKAEEIRTRSARYQNGGDVAVAEKIKDSSEFP